MIKKIIGSILILFSTLVMLSGFMNVNEYIEGKDKMEEFIIVMIACTIFIVFGFMLIKGTNANYRNNIVSVDDYDDKDEINDLKQLIDEHDSSEDGGDD